MVIYYELCARGYKVWISNEFEKPNKKAMIDGVKKSAVFVVFCTNGIFTRGWCRDVEIKTALEEKKPFVMLMCGHGDYQFIDRRKECSASSTKKFFGGLAAAALLHVWGRGLAPMHTHTHSITRSLNTLTQLVTPCNHPPRQAPTSNSKEGSKQISEDGMSYCFSFQEARACLLFKFSVLTW